MTDLRLCIECRRPFDPAKDEAMCPCCEHEDIEADDTLGKVDHQRALAAADGYIRLEQQLPGSVGDRALTLARCYKHNRDQISELRGEVKALQSESRLNTHTLTLVRANDASLIWRYLGDSPAEQRAQIVGPILPAPFHRDIAELAERVGRTFTSACMVANVAIFDPSLMNHGYGIQLYADLAHRAARDFQAPIVSSLAWGNPISPDAERVWNSIRLAKELVVCGHAAWSRSAEKVTKTPPR